MMDSKKERLKNLILYILKKLGQVPKVKLAKLILFSEIEYFKKTGESITGLYFVRLTKGPLIAFFDDVLEMYERCYWTKTAKKIQIYSEGRLKEQLNYSPLDKNVDIEESTCKIIDKVVSKYGKMTGTKLSNLSHSLPAWKYSEPDEPIYLSELSINKEEEYFALIDIVEDIEDDGFEKELSQALS